MQTAHGFHVRSTLALPGLRPSDGVPRDGLTVHWECARVVPDEAPDGDVMLRCEVGGRVYYTATRSAVGYRLRFHRCCEFAIDAQARTVDAAMHPGVSSDLGVIIAAGALLSFVLALRGRSVLHASAVEVFGGAVAITGPSGSGKSTVAALACAGGLPLVTDDVLAIADAEESAPTVASGATELRLRPAARGIVEQFTQPVRTRETADGRLAVAPAFTEFDVLSLTAIVLPRPRRDRSRLTARRLSSAAAMVHLLAMPRLLGWVAPEMLRRQFEDLAALARRLPIVELDVPWGPPFPSTLGRDIAMQLRDLVSRQHESTTGADQGAGRDGTRIGAG